MEKLNSYNKHFKDISGKRYNKLVVLEDGFKKDNDIWCKVLCDCGNIKFIRKSSIKNNNSRSCGCIHSIELSDRNKKHLLSKTKIYKIYHAMKKRCYDKNDNEYKNYGERGISICNEWLNDFMIFYNWSIQNGYTEGLSIDRIDVNGNYNPNNCRWIEKSIQQLNKRNSIRFLINGDYKNLCIICKEYNIKYSIVYKHLKKYGEESVIKKYFNA